MKALEVPKLRNKHCTLRTHPSTGMNESVDEAGDAENSDRSIKVGVTGSARGVRFSYGSCTSQL